MKNSIVCLLFFSGFFMYIAAEKGCIDNSKHLNTKNGYDYKKYHYVNCTCPCYRYRQSEKRGRCEKCLHYRAPKKLICIHEPPEFR